MPQVDSKISEHSPSPGKARDFYHVVDETLGEVDEDLGPEERG